MVKSVSKLIIFLIPPEKIVNGGVMSIFSLCEETRKLKGIHDSETVVCTYVGWPTYKKNDLFKNNEHIYDFEEITAAFPSLESLIIHVPELAVKKLFTGLQKYESYISKIPLLHINILNQNILYMPDYADIFNLYRYTLNITQTTAHDRYSTQQFSDKFGLPLKHFSVFIDPKQYFFKKINDKKNIISYSPDNHPEKEKILESIRVKHPEYQLREIKNISYEEYKEVISESKFVITFGEGFDGYFIESAFSGTIPIAVYNDDFFPAEYKSMPNIYKNYKDMLININNDLVSLANDQTYYSLSKLLFRMLSTLYDSKKYRKKLKDFYLGKYDFVPTHEPYKNLLLNQTNKILSEYNDVLNNSTRYIKQLEGDIEMIRIKNQEYNTRLEAVKSSNSWKITKPLRILAGYLRRK